VIRTKWPNQGGGTSVNRPLQTWMLYPFLRKFRLRVERRRVGVVFKPRWCRLYVLLHLPVQLLGCLGLPLDPDGFSIAGMLL